MRCYLCVSLYISRDCKLPEKLFNGDFIRRTSKLYQTLQFFYCLMCAFHPGQGGDPTGMAPRPTRVLGSIPVGRPPDQYVLSVSGAPLNLRQWDDDMETKDVIDRLLDKWTGCTTLPRLLGDLIQPGCRVTAVFLIERRSTKWYQPDTKRWGCHWKQKDLHLQLPYALTVCKQQAV